MTMVEHVSVLIALEVLTSCVCSAGAVVATVTITGCSAVSTAGLTAGGAHQSTVSVSTFSSLQILGLPNHHLRRGECGVQGVHLHVDVTLRLTGGGGHATWSGGGEGVDGSNIQLSWSHSDLWPGNTALQGATVVNVEVRCWCWWNTVMSCQRCTAQNLKM